MRQSSPPHPLPSTQQWVPQWQQGAGKWLKSHCGYHPAGSSNARAGADPHPRCLPHTIGTGCAGGHPGAEQPLSWSEVLV